MSGDLSATTASRVADDLRRRILYGELAPGQRLKIDELASLCDVSHMPVREALRELQGEGVLDVFPHRGAVIRGVDRAFRAQFLRRARRHRGHAYRALRGTGRRLSGRARSRLRRRRSNPRTSMTRRRGLRADRRFHDTINATADNPQALRMLAQGRVLAEALRLRFGYGGGRIEAIIAEHRALVRAIERRESARAGEIARRHCIGARDDLVARLAGGSA